MRIYRKAAYYLATIIMLPLVAGAVGLIILRVNGEQLLSAQTPSMEPTFSPGDALIIRQVPTNKLQVGDIVTYMRPSNPKSLITHRIVALDKAMGVITTAGDRRRSPDPSFSSDKLVGQATAFAPGLGRIVDAFHKPYSLAFLVYSPALIIIGAEVNRLSKELSPPNYLLDYKYAPKREEA